MTTKRLGLIMNGVTGRMGLNQHLIRSIVAIRDSGGVLLSNGDRMMPDPILVGRDAEKIERLARQFNVKRFTTDLDKALADKDDAIFFDAATTQARPSLLTKAINAGKHVYCEKPIATNLDEAVAVLRLAKQKGIKHGTVQDKLFLPGLKKLAFLRDSGFFGRMLSVRGEFGYWVFEGAGRKRSGRPGTIAARMAAASSWTWSATGATCSTICSARSRASAASELPTFRSVLTSRAKSTRRPRTIPPTQLFASRAA
jgi:predicted dehydrogenase